MENAHADPRALIRQDYSDLKARQLQTMPGAGPLTAIAMKAPGQDKAQFKTGQGVTSQQGWVWSRDSMYLEEKSIGAHGKGRPGVGGDHIIKPVWS